MTGTRVVCFRYQNCRHKDGVGICEKHQITLRASDGRCTEFDVEGLAGIIRKDRHIIPTCRTCGKEAIIEKEEDYYCRKCYVRLYPLVRTEDRNVCDWCGASMPLNTPKCPECGKDPNSWPQSEMMREAVKRTEKRKPGLVSEVTWGVILERSNCPYRAVVPIIGRVVRCAHRNHPKWSWWKYPNCSREDCPLITYTKGAK